MLLKDLRERVWLTTHQSGIGKFERDPAILELVLSASRVAVDLGVQESVRLKAKNKLFRLVGTTFSIVFVASSLPVPLAIHDRAHIGSLSDRPRRWRVKHDRESREWLALKATWPCSAHTLDTVGRQKNSSPLIVGP